MKRIEAIIDAEHFEKVNAALQVIGVHRILVTEVRGFIRKRMQPVGFDLAGSFLFVPKWKLDISVVDAHVRRAAHAIFAASNTRVIVDGKLFLENPDGEFAAPWAEPQLNGAAS
ncbi:Nitrogen regulatory protein P-II [Rosistilla carotiformis]|uniref:Nitrogen regulatory protein P-II n=1 Tax=Rosistilla carotiformis TaxID=2528017 RepID=A0A518JN21_9BACT|nr:P-II family nitrogen regulator [Rosistilla carotiformis]QDV66943.1 Nitrogen regulatory protein P-II [Rosistilla carotiformis]